MIASELRQATARLNPGIVAPSAVIEPPKGWAGLELRELWGYRELLYFLIWREIKVRYKQTAIGAAWAIGQPLMTMAIFTVIFGYFAKFRSDGVPYPVFALVALLPWTFFSQAISRSGISLVGDANLLKKVYFPRLLVPLSSLLAPLADFALSFVLLLGMMIWYGILPGWNVFALPLFLLLAVLTALAISLWLSALNVRYRDVGHAIPFLVQIWMYATPVAYPMSLVPERWQLLFSLNPMVGVVEGFRWSLLGKGSPHFGVILISTIGLLASLCGGVMFFKHMERTFADVV